MPAPPKVTLARPAEAAGGGKLESKEDKPAPFVPLAKEEDPFLRARSYAPDGPVPPLAKLPPPALRPILTLDPGGHSAFISSAFITPAGDQVINFTNDGPNDHFAAISRFPDGTTVEDAEAAMEAMLASETGPPEGTPEPEDIGFSGIVSEGTGMQFSLAAPLEPGVYSFICFISDRAGGPPHAVGHQMYEVVEIG